MKKSKIVGILVLIFLILYGINIYGMTYKAKSNKYVSVKYYTIKKNDTLYSIARKLGIKLNALVYNNPKSKNGRIYVGQKLIILTPGYIIYKVRRGNNLYYIAKKYNTTIRKIVKVNVLRTKKLHVYQRLFIPYYLKKIRIMRKTKKTVKKSIYKSKKIKYSKKIFYKKTSWPLKTVKVASKFGLRFHPVLKRNIKHLGVDLKAKRNTKIYAFYAGKVTFVGYKHGYGKMIIIRHPNGYKTRYAHLNSYKVLKNQWVKTGELIALSGATGRVTGPHLHFELRKNGHALNPSKYMKNGKKSY